MCGRATLAIEVSSTSINVARVTVKATAQRLARGFQTVIGAAGAFIGSADVWAEALIWKSQYRDLSKP